MDSTFMCINPITFSFPLTVQLLLLSYIILQINDFQNVNNTADNVLSAPSGDMSAPSGDVSAPNDNSTTLKTLTAIQIRHPAHIV